MIIIKERGFYFFWNWIINDLKQIDRTINNFFYEINKKNWCKGRFKSLYFRFLFYQLEERIGFFLFYLLDRLNNCHSYRYSMLNILIWKFQRSHIFFTKKNYCHWNRTITIYTYRLCISSFYIRIFVFCLTWDSVIFL